MNKYDHDRRFGGEKVDWRGLRSDRPERRRGDARNAHYKTTQFCRSLAKLVTILSRNVYSHLIYRHTQFAQLTAIQSASTFS